MNETPVELIVAAFQDEKGAEETLEDSSAPRRKNLSAFKARQFSEGIRKSNYMLKM